MSVATLERDALPRVGRVDSIPTDRDDITPLSLRAELFLLAHNEDTGRPHCGERAATRGLAAAVLLELWFAGRIHIGWRYDVRRAGWVPDPGRIAILNAEPTGDPIADAALRTLWFSPTMHVRDFVREYATPDLYERVRAYLVACGLLRRITRRRFWLFQESWYVPANAAYPVRARARVRHLTRRRTPETQTPYDDHYTALAALVTALGLTAHLNPPDMRPARLARKLREVVGMRADQAVRGVAATLEPGRAQPPAASN